MKAVREQTENKITLIISIALLIVLLIFLFIYLIKGNNNPTSNTLTTNCALESTDNIYETDSEVAITSDKEKVTRITINTVYTYTDNDLLMNYNYQEEKDKLENFKDIEGLNLNVFNDTQLGTITVTGDIDYTKIILPNKLEIDPPYDNYLKTPLSTSSIINYLTKEGYKCE